MLCVVNERFSNKWQACGLPATLLELDEFDKTTEYPVCQDHVFPGFTYREINETA